MSQCRRAEAAFVFESPEIIESPEIREIVCVAQSYEPAVLPHVRQGGCDSDDFSACVDRNVPEFSDRILGSSDWVGDFSEMQKYTLQAHQHVPYGCGLS